MGPKRAILLLAAALTAAAPTAFPAPPQSRQQALAQLEDAVTERRAEAVVWVANHGRMGDTELLLKRLRDPSPFVRDFAEQGLRLLWLRSGEADIDRLMARSTEEMQAGRLTDSIATLSEVIRRMPEYAEGWNRRATVYFLAGEYRKSIADCDETLKRNPKHFGALAGLGQIHVRLEEYERALEWFRRALEVNPNLTGVELHIRQIEERLEEKRARST